MLPTRMRSGPVDVKRYLLPNEGPAAAGEPGVRYTKAGTSGMAADTHQVSQLARCACHCVIFVSAQVSLDGDLERSADCPLHAQDDTLGPVGSEGLDMIRNWRLRRRGAVLARSGAAKPSRRARGQASSRLDHVRAHPGRPPIARWRQRGRRVRGRRRWPSSRFMCCVRLATSRGRSRGAAAAMRAASTAIASLAPASRISSIRWATPRLLRRYIGPNYPSWAVRWADVLESSAHVRVVQRFGSSIGCAGFLGRVGDLPSAPCAGTAPVPLPTCRDGGRSGPR
jgi:hypothetical protein